MRIRTKVRFVIYAFSTTKNDVKSKFIFKISKATGVFLNV